MTKGTAALSMESGCWTEDVFHQPDRRPLISLSKTFRGAVRRTTDPSKGSVSIWCDGSNDNSPLTCRGQVRLFLTCYLSHLCRTFRQIFGIKRRYLFDRQGHGNGQRNISPFLDQVYSPSRSLRCMLRPRNRLFSRSPRSNAMQTATTIPTGSYLEESDKPKEHVTAVGRRHTTGQRRPRPGEGRTATFRGPAARDH